MRAVSVKIYFSTYYQPYLCCKNYFIRLRLTKYWSTTEGNVTDSRGDVYAYEKELVINRPKNEFSASYMLKMVRYFSAMIAFVWTSKDKIYVLFILFQFRIKKYCTVFSPLRSNAGLSFGAVSNATKFQQIKHRVNAKRLPANRVTPPCTFSVPGNASVAEWQR